MNRDYVDGKADDVALFFGNEIEHTPAFGMKTLFVVGVQDPEYILQVMATNACKHAYLGANQSFAPETNEDWQKWDNMIFDLSKNENILITIDHDVKYAKDFLEMSWTECDSIIPMISVKIPYAAQYNYNTCVKVDDIDFRASNPGVWVHQLHDLMAPSKFTRWSQYNDDLPLE